MPMQEAAAPFVCSNSNASGYTPTTSAQAIIFFMLKKSLKHLYNMWETHTAMAIHPIS
jgi:hypothetical protein